MKWLMEIEAWLLPIKIVHDDASYVATAIDMAIEKVKELEEKLAVAEKDRDGLSVKYDWCNKEMLKMENKLEEKLTEAQKSLIDYETDWRKMRKYYDGAMVKMAIAIEALEKIRKDGWGTDYCDSHNMVADEALEKIKR